MAEKGYLTQPRVGSCSNGYECVQGTPKDGLPRVYCRSEEEEEGQRRGKEPWEERATYGFDLELPVDEMIYRHVESHSPLPSTSQSDVEDEAEDIEPEVLTISVEQAAEAIEFSASCSSSSSDMDIDMCDMIDDGVELDIDLHVDPDQQTVLWDMLELFAYDGKFLPPYGRSP